MMTLPITPASVYPVNARAGMGMGDCGCGCNGAGTCGGGDGVGNVDGVKTFAVYVAAGLVASWVWGRMGGGR